MTLGITEIILMSVVAMTTYFFVYFVLRGGRNDSMRASMGRIIKGALIAGIAMGLMLSTLLFMVLPTYHYIDSATPDGHRVRFAVNGNFLSECGLRYIINQTQQSYSLVAKVYGNDALNDDEEPVTPILPGKTRARYGIDGWFEPFPLVSSDDSDGTVERYVMFDDWVNRELEKTVSFEYDPE